MDVNRILSELDAEIARLQQIRNALTGLDGKIAVPGKAKRGRPKGSKNASTSASTQPAKKQRKLSPEGRKRIADAMKRRWAERRKTSEK